MAFARVALKFASLPDGDLDDAAQTVHDEMTGNAALFATPPVTMADFQNQIHDFRDKIPAANKGGVLATAAKNASRQVLIGIMRQLAAYVEMVANGDEVTVLKSGFHVRSTERSSLPLDKPTGLTITNDGEGKLNAEVEPVKNCSMYEGRAKADGATEWMESVFTGDSRHVLFEGLTPGVLYTIQVRALGGSTGTSDWSDPAQHRSL
jgi:hypothetical protein